jgi:zinc transport system substrate-binding protein
VVLAGPGQNPHHYEASPRQMAELAGASLWILSGAEFEISLRPRIAALFPRLPLLDGTEGVPWRTLEAHDDDHAPGGGHQGGPGEGGLDRHSWLGREPARILAAHVRDALSALDPENAPRYRAGCEDLIRDIDAEFLRLREELAPLRGRTVFVYHPAFGYFLDEFGILQEAVESGGKEPSPRSLSRIIALARREGAAAIFVQRQFPVNTARTAARAIGAELAALDPLAPDWLANIRAMGEALKQAASPRGSGEGRGP